MVAVIPISRDSTWRGTADCLSCTVREFALFSNLTEGELESMHSPIDDLQFGVGSSLYTSGETARGIFTVRHGFVKLVRFTSDGRQRIVRVLRSGDVAGIEALGTMRFDSEAIALTDVAVCCIPLGVIRTLSSDSPRLHQRLMEKWQSTLKEADDWLAHLNYGSARQRVVSLVLRMRDRQNSSLVTLFSREDMGSMLNLTLETVSREVSALVREKWLEPRDKAGRQYEIVTEALLGCE